jgi:hypothetical protein
MRKELTKIQEEFLVALRQNYGVARKAFKAINKTTGFLYHWLSNDTFKEAYRAIKEDYLVDREIQHNVWMSKEQDTEYMKLGGNRYIRALIDKSRGKLK